MYFSHVFLNCISQMYFMGVCLACIYQMCEYSLFFVYRGLQSLFVYCYAGDPELASLPLD